MQVITQSTFALANAGIPVGSDSAVNVELVLEVEEVEEGDGLKFRVGIQY